MFDIAQTLRGALDLSGLREHFTPEYVSILRRQLLAAAAELTQALGGNAPVYGVRSKADRGEARGAV